MANIALIETTPSSTDFHRWFDFEIDRYVIDNTTGNSNEQYIPFGNYSFNV